MNDQAKENFKRTFNHIIDTKFCEILNVNGGTLSYAGGKKSRKPFTACWENKTTDKQQEY
jgi:hypothetical protein